MSWWIRQLVEFLLRTQPVERATEFPAEVEVEKAAADAAAEALERLTLPGHFDNVRGLGHRDLNAFTKRSSGNRDLSKVELICVHQTAVAFGTAASRRKAWRRRITGQGIPPDDLEKFGLGPDVTADRIEAVARRMALHERFWRVPYHFVSLLNGDVLRNNPMRWRTWHGSPGGNDGLGWAMEGRFPILERKRTRRHDALDAFAIETGRAGLRLAVLEGRDAGCPIERLQPHRCYSPGRLGDTGEGLWREVMLPVAGEFGLVVDYEERRGGGRPVPVEWDDDAFFDLAGEKVG